MADSVGKDASYSKDSGKFMRQGQTMSEYGNDPFETPMGGAADPAVDLKP